VLTPSGSRLTAVDRLLDGVNVEVAPLAGRAGATPTVHSLRGGGCVIGLVCGATLRLSTDRVTIVPSTRGAGDVPKGAGPRIVGVDPGESPIVSACVRIRATYQGIVDLFDQFPEPLVEDVATDDRIGRCRRDLMDEIAEERPGRWAIAATLLRGIILLVLRRCFARGAGKPAWVAALGNAQLGRAVAAMCAHPEHAFTLPELAEIAGMSRSVFAAGFAETLKQPPIEFLKTLRLARAATLLAESELPIKAIAASVGYESRSSFTRAFVAYHGAAPAAFRAAAESPRGGAAVNVLRLVTGGRGGH